MTVGSKIGVLLINIGTPEAPTPSAVRRYLHEFLSDRRVVELPRALWWPVLYGFILPWRPYRVARAYAQIWQGDSSPLLAISMQQANALQHALAEQTRTEIPVALGMRYGSPSLESALAALEQRDVQRLLVLPLYPQYSATTTASALDALFAALGKRRRLPEIRTINHYHDHPAYIAALASSMHAHWRQHGRGDRLLISFHSIPQRYVDAGDPYRDQCQETARLLAETLQLPAGAWSVSYQSRIGRQPWLQPYTDLELPRLAAQGAKTLDVICPGFAVDCLETLEEVAIRYRAAFRSAGGAELRYVPALNAGVDHIEMLAGLVQKQLQGWLVS